MIAKMITTIQPPVDFTINNPFAAACIFIYSTNACLV